MMSGSAGQRRVPSAFFGRLPIPLLPLYEQRRIAEILDTADLAIRETETLIFKLEQMKTGLMHDLLTRGLDERDQLRDPDAHPEQFKDSPLGRIPREWEYTDLGSVVLRGGGVLQTGPFGSQLHAHEYVDEGVPVIMPQDIQNGEIGDEHIARIPEDKARSLSKYRLKVSDVIFSRRGDLERCAAIREREGGWICGTGCLLVRAPRSQLDSRWLAAIYQHDSSQRQIAARAVGTTMVNLNTSLLASLQIAKPDIVEQHHIAEILDAHDARIRAEEAYRDKLKLQKKGLMDDLLTGRVRVKEAQEVSS
jgi:type I restriction enzyme S subunit